MLGSPLSSCFRRNLPKEQEGSNQSTIRKAPCWLVGWPMTPGLTLTTYWVQVWKKGFFADVKSLIADPTIGMNLFFGRPIGDQHGVSFFCPFLSPFRNHHCYL